MSPEEQDPVQAAHNAAKYRDAEQRINDQIRSIQNQAVSPANKKEIRRLERLAQQKRTRADHYESQAKAGER